MNTLNETFKPIQGYEGKYMVSDLGNILALNYRNSGYDKLMKKTINKHTGYEGVGLSKDGKLKVHLVHRLVMMAFKPTSDKTLNIDHINNDRTDNRLVNLRWVSVKDNNSKPHARKMKSINYAHNTHNDEFIKAEKDGETRYFINQNDAAEGIGGCRVSVTKVLNVTGNNYGRTVKGWTLTYVPRSENPELDEKVRTEREERLGRTRRIKLELTKAKRLQYDIMKKEVKQMKKELNEKLKEKMKEYKIATDKSSAIWREIQQLQRKLKELDFKKKKWDMHSILQYDMQGKFIKEWRCASDIFKELGLDVNACVKGLKPSVGGFRWAFKIPRHFEGDKK